MLFINGAIRSLKVWCGGASALRSAVRTRPGVTCSIVRLLSSRVDRGSITSRRSGIGASACASHQAGGEERDGHGVEILELEQDDDRSKDSDERYVDVSHGQGSAAA